MPREVVRQHSTSVHEIHLSVERSKSAVHLSTKSGGPYAQPVTASLLMFL